MVLGEGFGPVVLMAHSDGTYVGMRSGVGPGTGLVQCQSVHFNSVTEKSFFITIVHSTNIQITIT